MNREMPVNTAHEPVDESRAGPLGDTALGAAPGGAFRGLLLASARTRFAVAILLSIALWAGYFWVAGYPPAT